MKMIDIPAFGSRRRTQSSCSCDCGSRRRSSGHITELEKDLIKAARCGNTERINHILKVMRS